MKKILMIVLTIVFVMSMTVTSFGINNPYNDPEVSLYPCMAIGTTNGGGMQVNVDVTSLNNGDYDGLVSSNPTHPFCILADEQQEPYVVYGMVTYGGGNDEYIKVIGMYEVDCSLMNLDELIFYPTLEGIAPATKADVYIHNGCEWERYDAETNFGQISIETVNLPSNTDNLIAIVLDTSTLIPGMQIIELNAKDANGGSVKGSAAVFPISYGFYNAPQEIRDFYTKDTHRDAIEAMFPGAENIQVISFMDIHFDDYEPFDFPVTVIFNVPGVTKDSNVVIRHLTEKGNVETITTICGEDTVTAEFNSYSPIIMYSYGEEATGAPVMGDGPLGFVITITVIALIASVFIAGRKEN